jgi:hypothetical protein
VCAFMLFSVCAFACVCMRACVLVHVRLCFARVFMPVIIASLDIV